ncbi:MAG: DUF1028 domain-containing protein [archaeon]|nr:DUF1028 domain-containing protein [archaeon]
MTFSIIGFDPENGDFGVAVQSKFICVGSVVTWAEAGVGAIATQADANTSFGPRGLEYLKKGLNSKEVLEKLLQKDDKREHRQLAIIDSNGNAAAHTGKECFYWAGHKVGKNYSCQGNILIGEDTIQDMASAFENQEGDLATKLLSALSAADKTGKGDVRGKQSSALLVVRKKGGYGGFTDRLIDIRVDEHPEPIKELHRIFKIYDMTLLNREDPTELLTIEGEIAQNVKDTLFQLGYLEENPKNSSEIWNELYNIALENWIGINNFENKWNDDGKIWNSIYQYMQKEKGTPMVKIKKMSEQ